MTLAELTEKLRSAGVDNPEHDARVLMREFGGKKFDTPLIPRNAESDAPELLAAAERRMRREPLQYIVGKVGFYREEYAVSEKVLIPRSDTEILVATAVKLIPPGENFIDLCCGSGCIAISVKKNTKNTPATAVDISDGALWVARENAIKNGEDDITFIKADVLSEAVDGEYFAVLSNPPYVRERDYEAAQKEIFYEPKLAFVAGEDGLIFYRRIVDLYKNKLKEGGFFAFEIGFDQAEDLMKIAAEHGFSASIIKDYSQRDRVAVLRKIQYF